MSYELSYGTETVQLRLRRAIAPVAADFTHYVLGANGELTRSLAAVPACHLVGSAQAVVLGASGVALPSGPVGHAAMSTCTADTGLPEGQGLIGVVQLGGRVFGLAPNDEAQSSRLSGWPHWVAEGGAGQTPAAAMPAEVLPLASGALASESFREGTPQETKYVSLLVVNDAARVAERGGAQAAAAETLRFVQEMNAVLAGSGISPRLRVVLRAQLSFAEGDPYETRINASGEIDVEQLLEDFLEFTQGSALPERDEAMLLSGFNFSAGTVGLAVVAGACGELGAFVVDTHDYTEVAPSQRPALQAFSRLAAVHELGHAVGMGHDGADNRCDISDFLMGAVGNPFSPGSRFSGCSLDEYQSFLTGPLYAARGRCLDDVPAVAVAACGDGVVSGSEECDCGGADCQGIDPCCDGRICRLLPGAVCSEFNDACCEGCQVVAAGSRVCRPDRGECDTPEVCDGESARCPADQTGSDGRDCNDGSGFEGMCLSGECRTMGGACEQIAPLLPTSVDLEDPVGACATRCDALVCATSEGACLTVTNAATPDGVPCSQGFCVDGACVGDGCPNDPLKVVPGECGCNVADTDSDDDGVADCNDLCPLDPAKTAPAVCGCGTADSDLDGDSTLNCLDGCPLDPNKVLPGACGCGAADTDRDGDGSLDCEDLCPEDPSKREPGQCGCGAAETDSDGDGSLDCNDLCPEDALSATPPCGRTAAGQVEGRTASFSARGRCSVSAAGSTNGSASSNSGVLLGLLGLGIAWRRRRIRLG